MVRQMGRSAMISLAIASVMVTIACRHQDSSPNQSSAEAHTDSTTSSDRVDVAPHEAFSGSGVGQSYTVSFESDGVARSMELFIPASNDGKKSLLIAFHGLGDTAANFASAIDAKGVADRLGVIVAVPQGLSQPSSSPSSWNAGACCAFEDTERNDVALLDTIPNAITNVTEFDSTTIDVAGFSNGGFMVEYLACKFPTKIRGGLSVAGSLPVPQDECEHHKNVRLVRFHGTDDTRVPFKGGEWRGHQLLSFDEEFVFWRNAIRCSHAPIPMQTGAIACRTQKNCAQGAVQFCAVHGLENQWPTVGRSGVDVFDVAWQTWTAD